MISRHSGDDIAAHFSKILSELKESKSSQSKNSGKVATASEHQDNSSHDGISLDAKPEDFLVGHSEEGKDGGALESEIKDFASYSKDGFEGEADNSESHAKDCTCCDCKNCVGCESCESNADDEFADIGTIDDSIISQSSQNLLFGLGKIAKELREKDENFAADMVEATAFGIISDLKKEAAKKLHVISELKKIAASVDPKDSLAADLIQVTINKIKQG